MPLILTLFHFSNFYTLIFILFYFCAEEETKRRCLSQLHSLWMSLRPSPFPEVVTAIPALVLPFPGILPSSMNHNYFNFQTAPSSGIESYPASLAPFGYSTGHPGYILAMPLQLCYMPPTYHTNQWSSVIYHY